MKILLLTLLIVNYLPGFTQAKFTPQKIIPTLSNLEEIRNKNRELYQFFKQWYFISGGSDTHEDDPPQSYQNCLTLKFTVNVEDYNRHTFIDSLINSIKECGHMAQVNKCTMIYVTIRMSSLTKTFRKTKRILYVSQDGKLYYDKKFKVEL